MNIRKLTFALLIVLCPVALMAQNDNDSEKKNDDKTSFMKYNHDLGFSVGTVTGLGLSYRHWFNNTKLQNFGIQATFNPTMSKNYQSYDGGLAFLYRLTDSEHASLFLYQANGIGYGERKSTNQPDTPDGRVYRGFSNGLGLGLEVVALKRLSINLMTGYHLESTQIGSGDFDTSFGLKGEIGLFYKF